MEEDKEGKFNVQVCMPTSPEGLANDSHLFDSNSPLNNNNKHLSHPPCSSISLINFSDKKKKITCLT